MAEKATSARIGQPVRRKEDLRLVTGKGCYTDDINLPDQAYAVMVRSPHAHARIAGVDIAAAMTTPGLLAVLTGCDVLADGLRPIPHKVWSQHPAELMLRERNGFKTFTAPHYPLPADKARFVGEAVAVSIAATVAARLDECQGRGEFVLQRVISGDERRVLHPLFCGFLDRDELSHHPTSFAGRRAPFDLTVRRLLSSLTNTCTS